MTFSRPLRQQRSRRHVVSRRSRQDSGGDADDDGRYFLMHCPLRKVQSLALPTSSLKNLSSGHGFRGYADALATDTDHSEAVPSCGHDHGVRHGIAHGHAMVWAVQTHCLGAGPDYDDGCLLQSAFQPMPAQLARLARAKRRVVVFGRYHLAVDDDSRRCGGAA